MTREDFINLRIGDCVKSLSGIEASMTSSYAAGPVGNVKLTAVDSDGAKHHFGLVEAAAWEVTSKNPDPIEDRDERFAAYRGSN